MTMLKNIYCLRRMMGTVLFQHDSYVIKANFIHPNFSGSEALELKSILIFKHDLEDMKDTKEKVKLKEDPYHRNVQCGSIELTKEDEVILFASEKNINYADDYPYILGGDKPYITHSNNKDNAILRLEEKLLFSYHKAIFGF